MKQLPRFTDLTLVLTERCNLRCSYCYVPKEGDGARTMSEEVALAAVDRFLDRAPAGKELSISFFGGEPFLERGLMERVVDHARARRPEGLTFSTPTNGTLLDDDALDLVRRSGMSLALSADGTSPSARRPDVGGRGTMERLEAAIPRVRDQDPIARMTVTPDNVDHLCHNVQQLFGRGLRRIMHQPALEQPWPEEAVDTWRAEHEALADWLCERYEAREPLPDMTVLEGIISRLSGAGMSNCGAGVTQAAVDPDGDVFGCFRSVSDARAAHLVLGNVLTGQVNEPLLQTYARLDPRRARPEDREGCKGCEAREGCTVYCAAMGHVLHNDLRAVGRDACRLARIQVEVCQDILRRMRRLQRASRRRASAQVAAAALALGLGVGAGCDSDRTIKEDSGAKDHGPGLCQADKGTSDSMAPGVCPKPIDGIKPPPGDSAPGLCPDLGKPDMMGPDLCPKPLDGMAPGLCPPPIPDKGPPKPGYCPYKPDTGIKKDSSPQPGVCPWKPDTGIKKDSGKPTPGVCPVPVPDAGKPTPGVCPVPMPDKGIKKDAGGPPPGLCPVPAPDAGKPKPGLC